MVDKYDISDVDFSEFTDASLESTKPSNKTTPVTSSKYDLSDVDFSEFVQPEPEVKEEGPSFFEKAKGFVFGTEGTPETKTDAGYLENIGRSALQRNQSVAGNFLEFLSAGLKDRAKEVLRFEANRQGVELDEVKLDQAVKRSKSFLDDLAKDTTQYDWGAEQRYTWEFLKENPNLLNVVAYSAETMGASAPDMLYTMTIPSIYALARIEEIGDERAVNKALSKLPKGATKEQIQQALESEASMLERYEATPTALGVIAAEKVGLERLFKPAPVKSLGGAVKEITKETGVQAGIEGLQEVGEYAGSTLGTGKELTKEEALDVFGAGALGGGPFGGAARTVSATAELVKNKFDKGETQPNIPSDETIADLIENAPDDETAAQIALDASQDNLADTTPEVEVPTEPDTFDIDQELSEAPELEPKLPQTLAPRKTGFFTSEQEALAYKERNLQNLTDAQTKAEMTTMQPVERVPGQWILEKQETSVDTSTETDASVVAEKETTQTKPGDTVPVYEPDGKSYQAKVVEVTPQGKILVEDKDGIQQLLDDEDSVLTSEKPQGQKTFSESVQAEPVQPTSTPSDLTPNGNDASLLPEYDRRTLRYHKKTKLSKHSSGLFANPFEHKIKKFREQAQKYIANIPPEKRAAFMEDLAPAHVVDPVTGFNRTEERDDTMDRVIQLLKDNPEMVGAAIYVEADIANLGGLNNELGNSEANGPFADMSTLLFDELDALGEGNPNFDIIPVRHGGDELSFIMFGVNKNEVDAALKRAEDKVYQYTKDNNLDHLTHAKSKQPKYGTGIIAASGVINPNLKNDDGTYEHKLNYSIADKVVEVRKEEVKRERAKLAGVNPDEFREEKSADSGSKQDVGVTAGQPGVTTPGSEGAREVAPERGDVDKNAEEAAGKRKLQNLDDLTPRKGGTYPSKEAAYRAKKQKARNKNLTAAEQSVVDDYYAVKQGEGYVLRHKSKLPEKTVKAKQQGEQARKETKPQVEKKPEPKKPVEAAKEPVKPSPKNVHLDRLESVLGEGEVRQVAATKSRIDKSIVDFVTKTLGKKIVYFESDVPLAPNGFFHPSDPNTLYLNVNAQSPHTAVLGHELLHALRKDNPEIYDDLKEALVKQLKDYSKYKAQINAYRKEKGVKELSDDVIIEELIADMVGDNFTDPDFWANLDVSESKLKKILEAIKAWLKGFYDSAEGSALAGTEYFDDYVAARRAVNEAIGKYQKAKTDELIEKIKTPTPEVELRGFLGDKTPLQKGKILKDLSKLIRFTEAGVMTIKERVESLADTDSIKLETFEENVIKWNRVKFNRMDNREQVAYEKKIKDAGTKTVYLVNEFDLGKTAYDYAKYLSERTIEVESETSKPVEKVKKKDSDSLFDEPYDDNDATFSAPIKKTPESTNFKLLKKNLETSKKLQKRYKGIGLEPYQRIERRGFFTHPIKDVLKLAEGQDELGLRTGSRLALTKYSDHTRDPRLAIILKGLSLENAKLIKAEKDRDDKAIKASLDKLKMLDKFYDDFHSGAIYHDPKLKRSDLLEGVKLTEEERSINDDEKLLNLLDIPYYKATTIDEDNTEILLQEMRSNIERSRMVDPENVENLQRELKEAERLILEREMSDGSDTLFSAPIKETPTKATGVKGALEEFQKKLIDSYQPIRKVQKEIEKTGEKLKDMFNIDQALTLFPGSTRAELDDFNNMVQKPFLELVEKTGLEWNEIAEYLHARHAVEANKIYKERNPDMEDNEALSGMTNEEARDIKAKYVNRPDVQAVGQMMDRMNKESVDYLVKEGLLSEEEANAWRENYKHYVPLHREDVDAMGLPKRGQGFDVRGKVSKIRTGSLRKVDYDNMLGHILAQQMGFIVKAKKNQVSKTLWNLAKEHPDSSLWETDRTKFPQTVATLLKSGQVSRHVNLQDMGVISHKVNGENKYLYLNQDNPLGQDMAKAFKHLGKGTDSKLINALSTYTRTLAMLSTSWSPEFIISNFFRDVQTATYNLTDTELKGFTTAMLKNVPSSMVAIRNALRGDSTNPDAQLFDQFRRDGGMTGWMEAYENIDDFTKALRREVKGWEVHGKKIPGRNQIKKLTDFVGDYNTVVENAVRFAAYKQALLPKSEGGAGLTRRQAAKIAKELTVDFNRKGEWGTTMNALYMFFNAGVQGSARILRAATNKENKNLRRMMVATVTASALLDIVNRLVSQGDDEDEESGYDKIREREGVRNLIIMLGEDDYLKVPLPWGYNVLHVIGQGIGSAASEQMGIYNQFDLGEESVRTIISTLEAFNPLQEGSIYQSMSPTALDPFTRIWENKDWHGGPLYPNYNPEAPNYKKFYGTAREESKDIARWLAEATLNPDTMKSTIDWSPEWIDMGFDFLTGGLGRFVADTENLAQNLISGDEFETKEIPFARKLVGEVGDSAKKTDFYDKMYDIVNMSRNLDALKKEVDGPRKYGEMRKQIDPNRLRLIEAAKIASRDVERFKKRIRNLEKVGNKEAAKHQEELMMKRMESYNKLYNKVLYGDKD